MCTIVFSHQHCVSWVNINTEKSFLSFIRLLQNIIFVKYINFTSFDSSLNLILNSFISFSGFHLSRPGEHESGLIAIIPENCRTTENQRTLRITLPRPYSAPVINDAATEGDDDGVRRWHPAPSTQRLPWKLRELVAKKSVCPDGANRQHATTGLNLDFIDLLYCSIEAA